MSDKKYKAADMNAEMAATMSIQPGQIWAYNKDGSPFSQKGDQYKIVATPLVKVGSDSTWTQGVEYVSMDADSKVFVRDEDKFRENFVFVEG